MSPTWFSRFDIRKFMVLYLSGLLLAASAGIGKFGPLFKGLAVVAVYTAIDLGWTYAAKKMWYLPLNSWISGLILALVAVPSPSPALIVALPLIAALAKRFLALGRPRHVFNPAALAMAACSIFVPAVSWWGASWSFGRWGNLPVAAVIALTGAFILHRLKRWHVALAYLAVYAVGLAVLLAMAGLRSTDLLIYWTRQLGDGTLLFFVTVMLIEPVTSAFASRRLRMSYAAAAAIFALLISYLGNIRTLAGSAVFARIDPPIFGLLLADLICALLFLKPFAKPAAATPPLPTS